MTKILFFNASVFLFMSLMYRKDSFNFATFCWVMFAIFLCVGIHQFCEERQKRP